ncbi:TetR/AcrR family transcriptional regulator [Allokutzneria sp. NRRL B-24872]|uniref:TetR/AcrR family transcriptional regulator n=1 Tax=Allokutzneria sp. NRRL B-24872 TaxID=1137961 RepID=UPI000A37D724|nr:TetR/AcrR family transcriptional regulator [Allokutzneria sp. NRRL B-24872]
MTKQGLRELKRLATRKHISDVATGLFLARGFDNVTVAEVAAAAEVSKMTVFSHFPRKEDLFLDRHAERITQLRRVLAERPAAESVVGALRRHQHHLLASRHPLSGAVEGVIPLWRVLRASPALVNRMYEHGAEMHVALIAVLEADGAEPTTARLFAAHISATLMSIFELAVDRVLGGTAVEEVRRRQVEVIDEAFDLLEKGMGDYGVRSRASMPAR